MSEPFAIPEVETERVLLRGVREDDLDAYHARVFADPDVMRYLPGGVSLPRERLDRLVERSHDHWRAYGYGTWVACDRASGELLGHCGLRFLEEIGETELLYAIARRWWGRGLVTEAARASVEFGFERGGLDRIAAFAVPENLASRRVMEKLGMTFEGEREIFDLHCVEYAISRA